MKVFAVRVKDDLWLDADGHDYFKPWPMFEGRARKLAAQVGGVVEEYEAVKVAEYSVSRVALPELRLEVG